MEHVQRVERKLQQQRLETESPSSSAGAAVSPGGKAVSPAATGRDGTRRTTLAEHLSARQAGGGSLGGMGKRRMVKKRK
jgi:hypothetical protein